MSVKQMNFGNLQRKEFEFLCSGSLKMQMTKNYERLVFEQEKGPVVH